MEQEHFTIQTDQYTPVNGTRTENMAMEPTRTPTEIPTKAPGKLTPDTARELTPPCESTKARYMYRGARVET